MSKLLELAKSSILSNRRSFPDMVKFSWQEGASKVETYLFHGCVKVGDRSIIKSQIKAYEYLKESLGSIYESIFPRFRLVSEQEDLAVLLLEFLDGRNLEDVCFEMNNLLPFLSIEHPIIQRKNSMIKKIVGESIRKLCLIFEKTEKNVDREKELFFLECFDALEVNLAESNLRDYLPVLQVLKKKKKIFLKPLIISSSHKDLTVRNVMVSNAQGEIDIKLVDPRISLPRSSKRYSEGSIVVDMAALEMSLSRKELELQQLNPAMKIKGINLVKAESKRMIKEGLFSKELYKLCLVIFYSAHAACNCVYCSARERSWLREVMKQKTRDLLNNLSQEVDHA